MRPNIIALSGFNPLNLSTWKIDRFFTEVVSYETRNWKPEHVEEVYYMYTAQFGNQPYILTCHSDGGTVAHELAHTDERCIGLHCHAASFNPPPALRDIPILLTYTPWDIFGMGVPTRRAYKHYKNNKLAPVMITTPRKTWHGHDYATCLEILTEWAYIVFDFNIELDT